MQTAQFNQLIADNTSDLIAVFDKEWKYIAASASHYAVLGYETADLVEHPIYEFIHPDDLDAMFENTTELTESFKTRFITYRIKRKDGIYIWVETTAKRFQDENVDPRAKTLFISKDVTTRKSSEEMVKKFVEGVENASDCIVMANPDGKIMYVNPAIKTMSGFAPEDLIGRHANEMWGGTDTNQIVNMWRVLQKNKKSYSAQILNKSKDGRSYYTEVHITPILNQHKEITFYVGISRDITKQREIDTMKNEFISLASHQLRTPLTAVKWQLEMLLGENQNNLADAQKKYLKNIETANERMIELVNALLNITRIESGRLIIEPKMTSLENLMMSVIDELEGKIQSKKLSTKISFQTNIYDIKVDPKLIRNVYTNLLSNAVKYTKEMGNIEISIYTEKDEVITKIKDDGFGIRKSEQNKIFQKFFRGENVNKIVSEGTGLGLYLAKKIVEESGGKIWFESEENKGTTFYVALNAKGSTAKKGEVSLS